MSASRGRSDPIPTRQTQNFSERDIDKQTPVGLYCYYANERWFFGRRQTPLVKREGNTRNDILDAAIDLFSENGVAGVSIRNITRQVGINESSLYNHFRGKEELLDGIIAKFQQEFGETVFDQKRIEHDLNGLTPEQFFMQHLLNLRNHITPTVQKMWKIVYLEMFRDQRARKFVLQEIIGRPVAYYKEVFRIMIERGLIKPIDPALLADELEYGFMGMSLESMLLRTDDVDPTPAAQRMFAHIRFLCESIQTKE